MFLHQTAHISAMIMLFVAIILTSTMHLLNDHGFSYGQHDICAQWGSQMPATLVGQELNQITTVQPLPLDQLLRMLNCGKRVKTSSGRFMPMTETMPVTVMSK